ncbi:MAG: dihydrofolate reductase family protein, partial [Roseomonas sp.]|nr:dihydrofolate reductase family protein [Roseomonas sp.]
GRQIKPASRMGRHRHNIRPGGDEGGLRRRRMAGRGDDQHRRHLRALGRRGVTRVLAEGGAGLAAALLRQGLVDRLVWFHAPAVMGGDGHPALEGLRLAALSAMPRFRRAAQRALGDDMLSEFERIED